MSMVPPEGEEDKRYLQEQIITYLGNKRKLLGFIEHCVQKVRRRLGGRKISTLDAFSGSGIVSRYLKQHAHTLYANDLEDYARVLNTCYLANISDTKSLELEKQHRQLLRAIEQKWAPGFITELYAPADDTDIQAGERAFYTRRNAIYLDTARRCIGEMPQALQPFFLAPLLYKASVHTNTSGVFKGFYKNEGGIGQFGGRGRHALERILAPIQLPRPLFSRFECELHLLQGDAATVAATLPELDLAYLDPPYNQHPYGANYFMLNLLTNYKRPEHISRVSGIPAAWKRSDFNKRTAAHQALEELLTCIPARFCLISYNSEGFITPKEMHELLTPHGHVQTMETDYAVFRGSRNLNARPLQVKEYLFLLERN